MSENTHFIIFIFSVRAREATSLQSQEAALQSRQPGSGPPSWPSGACLLANQVAAACGRWIRWRSPRRGLTTCWGWFPAEPRPKHPQFAGRGPLECQAHHCPRELFPHADLQWPPSLWSLQATLPTYRMGSHLLSWHLAPRCPPAWGPGHHAVVCRCVTSAPARHRGPPTLHQGPPPCTKGPPCCTEGPPHREAPLLFPPWKQAMRPHMGKPLLPFPLVPITGPWLGEFRVSQPQPRWFQAPGTQLGPNAQ